MLHLTMTMPLYLMMFSGSILLLAVLLLRFLLKKRLPGYVFPILWALVMLRFLVPFSLSSPLSLKLPQYPAFLQMESSYAHAYAESLPVTTGPDMTEDAAMPDASAISAELPNISAEHSLTENIAVEENTSENIIQLTDDLAYAFSSPQLMDSLPSFYQSPALDTLRLTVYLLGIAVTAGILLLQKYHYTGRLKNSLLIEHNEAINTLLREMSMAHILVFSNDEIASPLVCGLLTPRIYLPTRMDYQNRDLLRHILAHETMHIKRRDNWIKAVMFIVLCLNWFNPLVWIMARCLSSDLETACDEAVLRACQDEDARKSYAFSLLAMAVTANRSSLLYSAFSKTEVERRIQRILRYQKTSALMALAVFLFLTSSTVVFATGIQAPFDTYLSSTCYYGGSDSRWAFKVFLTRDIALGENAGKRADDAILDVLEADDTGDPETIGEAIKTALAREFHVEKSAFNPVSTFCIDEETEAQEYAAWELTRNEEGFFLYQGEMVHSFTDEVNKTYQTFPDGTLDIVVQRNRYGYISSVMAYEDGIIVHNTYTYQR